ncbi:MAG TPA: nucleotide exchange factor GrpE [Pirellulales bacterium]|nr:nucleotide exchange factor GrpE [Pirellulales bacterium]
MNRHSQQPFDDPGSDEPQTNEQSFRDDSEQGELEQLRGDLREATDRVLRAQADLENYRKRARRELEDERRYANLPLLRDLLPVVDNIQRAIAAAEKSSDSGGLLDGIRMVASSLETTLARHHCKRIEALNQPFDPAFHEAIAQQPSASVPPHTVVAVAQEGYVLYDRVVRPSQVVVSTVPASDGARA